MISNTEITKDLCNLIFKTFNLSVFFINPHGEISIEFTHNFFNPLYKNDKQHLFQLLKFEPNQHYSFPVIKNTLFRENFICISVFRTGGFEGTVIIGPSMNHHLSDTEINGIIYDTQTFTDKNELFHFYHSVPVIKRDNLVNISLTIFYMLNQKLLTFDNVINENKELEHVKLMFDNPDIEVSKRLQKVSFHHDPLFEKRLLKNIREGRIEEVKKYFNSVPEEEFGVLSKSSYIRSKKNLIISGITMATRASMDGGLHSEIAYTLSDTFIQRLEELNEVNEINNLMEEALCTFAEKVLKVRENRYSKTVTTCQNYIFNHLYEEINHEELANVVELNPNYLSVLFKKEVGLTVREYIQQVKIEEAKNLLAYTNTPLSEICSWLNFTDQSYFTKVFKKFAGITPKQYREKYLLI